MTFLPPEEDHTLINFLRENRPLPPTSPHLEARIMQQISQEKPLNSGLPLWLLPGTLICTLALGWGIYRTWRNPQPQIAAHPQEIENFVVESWQGSVNASPDAFFLAE
jgi:hypothetical protein